MLCNRRKCNCLKHTTGPHIGCPHHGVDSSGALWGHSSFQPALIAPPQDMAGSSNEDHNTSEKTYLRKGKILSGRVKKYKEQPCRHKGQWRRNRRICSILALGQRAIWAQIPLQPVKGPMTTVIFFLKDCSPWGEFMLQQDMREREHGRVKLPHTDHTPPHLPCIAQEMGGEEWRSDIEPGRAGTKVVALTFVFVSDYPNLF